MKELLPLTQERWIEPERILTLVEQFVGKTVMTTRFSIAFYFLNGLCEMVRLFPVGVFPSLEQRDGLMSAFQGAKDQLAAQEDEYLAAQEEAEQ